MSTNAPLITGIGSVSPYGARAGIIPQASVEPRVITAWNTSAARRAFTVEPFRPAAVVAGLKTRRLDRLSAWTLVASVLALQDAGIDLAQLDRTRVAVVFATSFGCVELTEAFYQSAAKNGWASTDPILFPETLANAPASHVALFHQLLGPNITVSNKNFAAESALLQAASLLRHGMADVAVVLAGDLLTQPIFEWYEQAGMLSPACCSIEPVASEAGFVPSEGVAALVLESSGRTAARAYARVIAGRWASGGNAIEDTRRMLGPTVPETIICACNGAPCDTCHSSDFATELTGSALLTIPQERFAAGLADTGGLFHLILALRERSLCGHALMMGLSGNGGHAAILLELMQS